MSVREVDKLLRIHDPSVRGSFVWCDQRFMPPKRKVDGPVAAPQPTKPLPKVRFVAFFSPTVI